jgi:hypothetical protein
MAATVMMEDMKLAARTVTAAIGDTALGPVPQRDRRTSTGVIEKDFRAHYPENAPISDASAWTAFHPIQGLNRRWNRPDDLLQAVQLIADRYEGTPLVASDPR